jgi:hypothetical protein
MEIEPSSQFVEPPRAPGVPLYTAEAVQSMIDDEHLRLLRLGYFISAAHTAMYIFVGLFNAGMGIFIAHLPLGTGVTSLPSMPLLFGLLGSVIMGLAGIGAVLQLVTGMRLKERRSRLLCLITASLTVLEIPYGTALGLMTLSVLARPSVRRQFERTG